MHREDSARDPETVVELGVDLLAHLEHEQLPLAAVVDRIETITTDPALTREILDTAETRGLIEREDGLVQPRSGAFLRLDGDVIAREGEFTCRRCGASLSTGHFIQFEAGEHGPFGSSCIRKVTGRD
ncbi:MarR family transcriptional regulator [Halobacteriales archaeon QH_10_67_13]|nr:MAG: MarR family transcriptional regulator [Halobacteriales archaeon QH_10_67_13]